MAARLTTKTISPIAHHIPPIAYRLLRLAIASCQSTTVCCPLLTACRLRLIDDGLAPSVHCLSPITYVCRLSPIAHQLTYHLSPIECHLSLSAILPIAHRFSLSPNACRLAPIPYQLSWHSQFVLSSVPFGLDGAKPG